MLKFKNLMIENVIESDLSSNTVTMTTKGTMNANGKYTNTRPELKLNVGGWRLALDRLAHFPFVHTKRCALITTNWNIYVNAGEQQFDVEFGFTHTRAHVEWEILGQFVSQAKRKIRRK